MLKDSEVEPALNVRASAAADSAPLGARLPYSGHSQHDHLPAAAGGVPLRATMPWWLHPPRAAIGARLLWVNNSD